MIDTMERKGVLSFEIGRRKADVICQALGVEGKHRVPGTSVSISIHGDLLRIEINARDSSSLRASINSYLNWLSSLTNLLDIVNGGKFE